MSVFKKNENIKSSNYVVHKDVRNVKSLIGKTLFIKGDIRSDEELLIEGKVEGKLNVKNRVIIGKNGIVNAEIKAREVIIRGKVNGDVNASYKVEIEPEGVLNGNIFSQRVHLTEGSVFKGNIDMSSKDKDLPLVKSNEKAKEIKK